MSTPAATVAIRLLMSALSRAKPTLTHIQLRRPPKPRKRSSPRKLDARGRSRSPPTGFRLRRIHRHCRNEPIVVRHFDLRQTLGVHDVGLGDDAVAIEQECR